MAPWYGRRDVAAQSQEFGAREGTGMTFDTSAYLRKATSRAKSDVANKLISMFLHEISRRLVSETGLSVTDPTYVQKVSEIFGSSCSYCNRILEEDRAAVEHPDGMNRFRVGLHVPGNVIVACKRCNTEKRRDDSLRELKLAETGWESFLSHDETRCIPNCKTCAYWRSIWPDPAERVGNLENSRRRIILFRRDYATTIEWSAKARLDLRQRFEKLYRDCQDSATSQIQTAADLLFEEVRMNLPS
jgi:hypothetical protein